MNPIPDVAIVGGGVVGLALADALAGSGARVLLLERGALAREASRAAAGMLAPQSEMDEPGAYLDFCLASARMYPAVVERLRERTGIDPQYRAEGMLYVAFSEEEERVLRARAEWQRAAGLAAETLSAEAARAEEPAIAPDARMAVRFSGDRQLDARLLAEAYAASARRAGATIREGAPVAGLVAEGGRVVGVRLAGETLRAGRVVIAAGAWSGLIEGVHPALPTYPVKGQVLALRSALPAFRHTLHDARIYLVPRLDGRTIVGATEEHEAGFDRRSTAGGVARLLRDALRLAPALAEAELVETWTGLRPGTPDRRAILGPSLVEGLEFATGHFRNGVLLAPITAARFRDYFATGAPPADLAPFSCERFARP